MNAATRLLGGRYQVGALIGRGGMAEVHAGHDTRLGRTVAIKMLRSDLARDPAFLARFRREAQSAAGLNHPAIVAVYDSGEDEDTETGGAKVVLPYIVMEYVEGRTLRDILNETTVMESGEAARVTEGVLDALSYSHRMGIVHRDIKPANVMVTPAGAIKVMDFGIARAIADTAATMTQTHSVIGTAQYLSPEQAQGNPVDARSDIYSTGCLLYELLTGRTPFVGDSPVSIAYQHVGEAPQPPSLYESGLSPDLDAVVLHALVKDRDARYQDAGQFRTDLAAARGGRPISSAAHGTAAVAALGAAGIAGDPTMAIAQGDPTQVVNAQTSQTSASDPVDPGDRTQVVGAQGDGPQHNTATLPVIGRDPSQIPAKHHKATYALLTLAVIAALVLVGLAGRAMFGGKAPPLLTVPSVVSLTQAKAVAKLQSVGFVAAVSSATSEVDKGKVIDQSPPANEKHPAKTTITITVSSGPGEAVVPDVTGFTVDSAKAAIENVGLTVGEVDSVNDPTVDEGKVIETVPKGDATVTAGSAVKLKVSSGKVRVPDVVGDNRGDAQQALTDARLKYRTEFADSDRQEGTVLTQTHAGDVVSIGTRITLVVAQVPQPTATPTPTTTAEPPPTTPPTTATTTPRPKAPGRSKDKS